MDLIQEGDKFTLYAVCRHCETTIIADVDMSKKTPWEGAAYVAKFLKQHLNSCGGNHKDLDFEVHEINETI